MQQLGETRSRPRIGKPLAILATALLCTAALGQPNLADAAPDGGGGSTAADLAAFMAGFTPAAFMPVDFTPAGFMPVDFALAGFMVDFTAVSPGCTMVSATDTELIGSTAGTTVALAGGGATGWLDLLSVSLRMGLQSGLRLL